MLWNDIKFLLRYLFDQSSCSVPYFLQTFFTSASHNPLLSTVFGTVKSWLETTLSKNVRILAIFSSHSLQSVFLVTDDMYCCKLEIKNVACDNHPWNLMTTSSHWRTAINWPYTLCSRRQSIINIIKNNNYTYMRKDDLSLKYAKRKHVFVESKKKLQCLL